MPGVVFCSFVVFRDVLYLFVIIRVFYYSFMAFAREMIGF